MPISGPICLKAVSVRYTRKCAPLRDADSARLATLMEYPVRRHAPGLGLIRILPELFPAADSRAGTCLLMRFEFSGLASHPHLSVMARPTSW